ncbi:hypothetical protein BS50DRAFT_627526 [Corynespora cassiicola Philippines]|uniref:Uncharacterized protein n=1 Tax=Corynespora cassiicola Philippines TaxID=1448308 RepID=A0A2T2P938_CORCC|nr:hypothetical protein BS50DRAFT_627526 [Corynespora cassiicola Philippines]
MRYSSIALLAAAIAGLTSASPTPQGSREKCSINVKIWQPEIYTMFPDAPDLVYKKNNNKTLYISQEDGGKDPRIAVLVWKNVPKTNTCSLIWHQPPTGTNFGSYGTAQVGLFQLRLGGKSFLDAVNNKPNWTNVGKLAGIHVKAPHNSPAANGDDKSSWDFTAWPKVVSTSGQTGSTGLEDSCEGEVAIFLRWRSTEEAMIVLQQSAADEYGLAINARECVITP